MKNGNKIRIAVVNSSSFGRVFPEHMEEIKKLGDVRRFDLPSSLSGKRLSEELEGYKIIVASVSPFYDKEFFEYNKDVILITRHGIGVNNIDLEAATQKGVLVSRVPGKVEQEAMAEHTITLMLTVLRKIVPAFNAVQKGKWKERAQYIGIELRNRTVGVVGIGNIGSRVAEILKDGFGARVIAYDPNLSSEEVYKRCATPVAFEELLRESDVITLHAPLNSATFHMIGKREFSLMKDGVVLIDTARGELIDTEAMIEALEADKIFGVGMDVVEGEPIDKNHPLLKFDNVVIVPHIGAYTKDCLKAMGDKVISDIKNLLIGKIPEMLVNPEVLNKRGRLDGFGSGS